MSSVQWVIIGIEPRTVALYLTVENMIQHVADIPYDGSSIKMP